jgi:O-antigen/teichoic acid export membrane protein
MALLSPVAAAFFRTPELRNVILVNCLAFFITGFQSVPQGLLLRDLDYKRLSIAEAVLVLTQSAVMVSCALAGFSYWSLVAGAITGKAAAAALVNFWKPVRLALPEWEQIRKPLLMGSHMSVSGVASTAYVQMDSIVTGRMLGAEAAGNYRMAMNLAAAPAEKIGSLIMRVTGPLFIRVREDKALLRRYFLAMSEFLTMAIFPLVIGLATVAPDAVTLLLGRRWSGAAGPLPWLALYMGVRVLSVLMMQVLQALRFTGFGMWISLFNLTVMTAAFWGASHLGLWAIAAAWVVMTPITVGPIVHKLLRSAGLRALELGHALVPALVGSAFMVVGVFAVSLIPGIAGWPVAVRAGTKIAAGGLVYGAVMLLLYSDRIKRYLRLVRSFRSEQAVAPAL